MDQSTPSKLLRLKHADQCVEISPALGGTILNYRWRDVAILRPTDGVPETARLTACYPLVPFSNRIANGRMAFHGKVYPIPRTVDYAALPMHGLTWQRPWRVASHDDRRAVLFQDYTPEAETPAWPFPFAAEQTFELTGTGLRVTLTVRNTGAAPQPMGVGWHPYFPRTPETRVWADVGDMWVNDPANLPVRLAPPPSALHTGMAVLHTDYDNVFRDFRGRARIAWPERDAAVTMSADATLSHLVVFTPPGKPHLAVEPVSHMTDAFNRYSAHGGKPVPGVDPETGTAVLAPDRTLHATMFLRPTTLADAAPW
ncbi:aldose 1-epimerase [Bordetella genomosp. 9]|uniref:aldose 1-epimerase n=1 Tax=Bordetella genomosp. 9 TaxID=1416803 RepID=UPI0012FBEA6E|nr:aldose 1-epimerase [Bordetella genomosp. 9]